MKTLDHKMHIISEIQQKERKNKEKYATLLVEQDLS